MRYLLFVGFITTLAACTLPGRVATLESEPPATEKQIAERRALLSADRPMQPVAGERFDVAVVGGSCAPKVAAKFAVTACVNEQPCNGYGLRVADGSIVCDCFGVRGGCERNTFCHVRARACTKLPADLYHVQ